MDLNLKGKNALVGGASRGIGKATAIALSKMGASVTLVSRDADELTKVVKELHRVEGSHHDFLVVDFSNSDDVADKVKNLCQIKNVHIVINNTGGPKGGELIKAEGDEFINALRAHVVAAQIIAQITVPGMIKDGYGRFINIISTSVKQPIPGLGVSNTTRGAMASWSKTMATELGPHGITVNNVLPGMTMTGRLDSLIDQWAQSQQLTRPEMEKKLLSQIPAGRFAQPDEVANAAAFLASPSAAYINGINVPVDGGRIKGL